MQIADGKTQPLCSGVLIHDGQDVLFTLGTPDRWSQEPDGQVAIPLGGVGGGQLPDESMQGCARREAREEIGCEVDLLDSRTTYMEDEPGKIEAVVCEDSPAPLLYQVQHRLLAAPYAPGLPAGDRLHVGIFRASPRGQPRPGDVPALLWVPVIVLPLLTTEPDLSTLEKWGARVSVRVDASFPARAKLTLPQPSAEQLLLDVVSRFGKEALGI